MPWKVTGSDSPRAKPDTFDEAIAEVFSDVVPPSPRETAVLWLAVGHRLSDAEIACELAITPKAVYYHQLHAVQKAYRSPRRRPPSSGQHRRVSLLLELGVAWGKYEALGYMMPFQMFMAIEGELRTRT